MLRSMEDRSRPKAAVRSMRSSLSELRSHQGNGCHTMSACPRSFRSRSISTSATASICSGGISCIRLDAIKAAFHSVAIDAEESPDRYFGAPDRDPCAPFRLSHRVENLVRQAGNLVHAIGIGRKWVEGKRTATWCIRLYVSRKLPKSLILGSTLLPELVDAVPTDVAEAPPAFFATPMAPCSNKRRARHRPALPGTSCGNASVLGGTLGAWCTSTRAGEAGSKLLLSNNHVLADFGKAAVGSKVYQPSVSDGGKETDELGALLRLVPIVEGTTAENEVDAAIATLTSGIEISREICGVGAVSGVGQATEAQVVQKHGRTTGLTTGIVDDIACDVLVPLSTSDPATFARFIDQIRIRPWRGTSRFAQQGDSGALVVSKLDGKAVGLLFACPDDGSYAYANPIQRVQELLQVQL